MRLWLLTADEVLTDDRAYLLGALSSRFSDVVVTRLSRDADTLGSPARRPDIILNLVGMPPRSLLDQVGEISRRLGVPISNPVDAAWRSKDKRTYLLDYPDIIPPSAIVQTPKELREALAEFGGDVVVKDPFGSRGNGVERVTGEASLQAAYQMLMDVDCGALVVQKFCPGFSRGDKRVIAQQLPSGDYEVIAYFERVPQPGGWKSNLMAGGRMRRTELTASERDFALDVAKRTGLHNVAMDIAHDSGRLLLIETNQNCGGLIDFDIDRGARSIDRVVGFIVHLAREGAIMYRCGRERSDNRPLRRAAGDDGTSSKAG